MLFDGTLDPRDGRLTPDRSRLGLGLTLKEADARRYAVESVATAPSPERPRR
jgi:hypothetical protein